MTDVTTPQPESTVLSAMSGNAYLVLIGLTAAMGGFLFGFDTGVISGALPALEKHFQISEAESGFAVGIVFIGSLLGGLFGGVFSDRIGRRWALRLSGICFLLSAVIAGLAQSLWQFNFGRFLGGIGIGVSLPIVGVYLAEIAPPGSRGRVVSLNQLVITFGILVSFLVGWAISNTGGEFSGLQWSWRHAFAIQAVPSALFIVLLVLIPESPRWLLQQGRDQEAFAILSRVEGPKNAGAAMAEIRQTILAERDSVRQLFQAGTRWALFIGVMLSLFDQFTGINIVIYYIQKILLELGFSEQQAKQGMVLLGVNNFVTTVIALAFVDRVGRKPLLIWCPIGMGVSLFLVGLQFYSGALPPIFVLFAIMAYCFFYALGPGPVNLLILSEIFPTNVRGQAAGICTLFMWVSTYIVSVYFPPWLKWSQSGTFWILTVTCLLYAAFSWWAVPETRGKSLEEIERQWQ